MDMNTYTELSPEIDHIIENVLKGTADQRESSLLKERLAASPDNRRIFEQKRALHEVLDPPFAPDSINTEKALSYLHRKMSKGFPRRLSVLRIAAAMVPILSVAVAYLLLRTPSEGGSIPMLSLSTPFGGLLQTQLPDSSHIWLNANSSLEYPAVFDENQRRVVLQGEGYFEVKADKKHPFIVCTGDIDIIATGTAFNVNAYEKSSVDVTLVEGHVDVNVGANRHFVISPGERLCIRGNSAELSQDPENKRKYSWKNGKLMFNNDRLDAVLARLSQIYPVDFVIQDSSLAETRYHATFSGESIHDILHLLEIGVPMQCVPTQRIDSSQRMIVYVYPPQKP